MSEKMVPEHEQALHISVEEIIPEHIGRTESALFEKNRRMLVEEHDLPCFAPACATPRESRQVHHLVEWCTWPDIDPERMRTVLEAIDPYGFSKLYRHRPIESPDDARNLIVLCQHHHTGKGFGIHYVPFPIWLPEACVKDGKSVIDVDHLQGHK